MRLHGDRRRRRHGRDCTASTSTPIGIAAVCVRRPQAIDAARRPASPPAPTGRSPPSGSTRGRARSGTRRSRTRSALASARHRRAVRAMPRCAETECAGRIRSVAVAPSSRRRMRKRHQVVVVHPDQVVGFEVRQQQLREPAVDALVGLVVFVVVADGVEEVVEQRPQRAVAEPEVVLAHARPASGRRSAVHDLVANHESHGASGSPAAISPLQPNHRPPRACIAAMHAQRETAWHRRASRHRNPVRNGDEPCSQHVLPGPAQPHARS